AERRKEVDMGPITVCICGTEIINGITEQSTARHAFRTALLCPICDECIPQSLPRAPVMAAGERPNMRRRQACAEQRIRSREAITNSVAQIQLCQHVVRVGT